MSKQTLYNILIQMEGDKQSQYVDQYRIKKILGSGYSAEVKLGVNPKNELVAIKQYKHQTSTLQTLKAELSIMKELNHQNIVKLISVRQHAVNRKSNGAVVHCFVIVLQYASGGELFNFIAQTGKFSQKITRAYFTQMLNGLEHIHDKGFAHRDIKPQNLLLTSNFLLKITDFGFSCMLKGRDGKWKLHTELGTQGYMAPEILFQNYDGRKTDIFAAGAMLFIMYVGGPPFDKASTNDPWYKLLKDKKYDVYWKAHSQKKPLGFFSESFKDLIQKMLAFDPNQRPTILEILNHPWTKGSIFTSTEIIQEFEQRKQKLDSILQKKRAEKQLQKEKRNQNINHQGYKHRDNGENQYDQFMKIYNKQKLCAHQLTKIEQYSLDDIIVYNSDYAYVKSILKEYIISFKLVLEQQQSEQIVNENEEYCCELMKQQGNMIHLLYVYRYLLDNQTVQSKVELQLIFGLAENKGIQVHFKFIDGNFFYYKKIIQQIKMHCFP